MGAQRADLIVALQEALMRAARDFGAEPAVAPRVPRALAAAAALDYVLMLARNADDTEQRDAEQRERACRDGIARAVDELLAAAAAIRGIARPEGRAFVADVAPLVRRAMRDEGLESDERAFALIALANA